MYTQPIHWRLDGQDDSPVDMRRASQFYGLARIMASQCINAIGATKSQQEHRWYIDPVDGTEVTVDVLAIGRIAPLVTARIITPVPVTNPRLPFAKEEYWAPGLFLLVNKFVLEPNLGIPVDGTLINRFSTWRLFSKNNKNIPDGDYSNGVCTGTQAPIYCASIYQDMDDKYWIVGYGMQKIGSVPAKMLDADDFWFWYNKTQLVGYSKKEVGRETESSFWIKDSQDNWGSSSINSILNWSIGDWGPDGADLSADGSKLINHEAYSDGYPAEKWEFTNSVSVSELSLSEYDIVNWPQAEVVFKTDCTWCTGSNCEGNKEQDKWSFSDEVQGWNLIDRLHLKSTDLTFTRVYFVDEGYHDCTPGAQRDWEHYNTTTEDWSSSIDDITVSTNSFSRAYHEGVGISTTCHADKNLTTGVFWCPTIKLLAKKNVIGLGNDSGAGTAIDCAMEQISCSYELSLDEEVIADNAAISSANSGCMDNVQFFARVISSITADLSCVFATWATTPNDYPWEEMDEDTLELFGYYNKKITNLTALFDEPKLVALDFKSQIIDYCQVSTDRIYIPAMRGLAKKYRPITVGDAT
jgi:hypothetical protein